MRCSASTSKCGPKMAGFAQQRYPSTVPALLELLEPFGEELAKAYG